MSDSGIFSSEDAYKTIIDYFSKFKFLEFKGIKARFIGAGKSFHFASFNFIGTELYLEVDKYTINNFATYLTYNSNIINIEEAINKMTPEQQKEVYYCDFLLFYNTRTKDIRLLEP